MAACSSCTQVLKLWQQSSSHWGSSHPSLLLENSSAGFSWYSNSQFFLPPPQKKQKTRPITMLRHTQGQKLAVTSHNSSQLETNTVWIWAVSNTSDHKMKSSWQASAFLQCLKTFRQHVILNCQAWELKRSWLMKDPQLQRCPVSKRKPKFS